MKKQQQNITNNILNILVQKNKPRFSRILLKNQKIYSYGY